MIWKYIKGEKFLKDYAPHIKSVKKKMSGKNSNGNPIDFSHAEKQQIKAALKKLVDEIGELF